jgi:hypothetical protein
MRSFFCISVMIGGFLATQATAQIPAPFPGFGIPALQTAIGPDGTFYALAPATGSTNQNPMTEVTAISTLPVSVTAPNPKWMATITGRVSQFLPGATAIFVVQTSTSGSGRNATLSTSLTLLSTATGDAVTSTPISLTGNISSIEVRTVGTTTDYLYVTSVATSSSTTGGSTTFTTTTTLTIYSSAGTVIKTVML